MLKLLVFLLVPHTARRAAAAGIWTSWLRMRAHLPRLPPRRVHDALDEWVGFRSLLFVKQSRSTIVRGMR